MEGERGMRLRRPFAAQAKNHPVDRSGRSAPDSLAAVDSWLVCENPAQDQIALLDEVYRRSFLVRGAAQASLMRLDNSDRYRRAVAAGVCPAAEPFVRGHPGLGRGQPPLAWPTSVRPMARPRRHDRRGGGLQPCATRVLDLSRRPVDTCGAGALAHRYSRGAVVPPGGDPCGLGRPACSPGSSPTEGSRGARC